MPEFEIRDWKEGVITDADVEDIPGNSLTRSENFRHIPGKLIKTYGAGLLNAEGAIICPIIIDGWTVKNIYTYTNANLPDGYVYVAVVRNDSTGEFRVMWFVADLAPAEDEPAKLTPFAADSFWMQVTDSQTYVSAGFALIMSTIFSDGAGEDHQFPTSAAWHIPNDVDGGNATTVFGGVPSSLGLGYNMEEALYTDTDTDPDIITDLNDYFDSHVQLNGRVHDFVQTAPFTANEIRYISQFEKEIYVAVEGKGGSNGSDLLFRYDTAWTQLDWSDLTGYTVGSGLDDIVIVNGFKNFDGKFYMSTYYYNPTVGGASLYNFDLWLVNTTTFGSSTRTYNEASATLDYKYDVGDTSMTLATYSAADYLFILHTADGGGPSSTIPGLLKSVNTSDTPATVALPATPIVPTSFFRSSTVLYTNAGDGLIYVASVQTSGAALDAELWKMTAIAPTWAAESLPSGITGISGTSDWKNIKYVLSYSIGASDYTVFVASIKVDSDPNEWYLVQELDNDWIKIGGQSFPEATETPHGFYLFQHTDRTTVKLIFSVAEVAANNVYAIDRADAVTMTVILTDSAAGEYFRSFWSYETTHDHLSVITLLIGQRDENNFHPTLYKQLCIGANPAWGGWDSTMEFQYTVEACVAWQLTVGGTIPTLWHKNAQNPIVLDKGVLRILPGAVGEISGNEAVGLWIGYIDRDFFDELYTPDAAFWAGPTRIDTPAGGTNAGLTLLSSGVLVVDDWYLLDTKEAGDDFDNTSTWPASPVTGTIWKAIATTPNTWTNGSKVLHLDPEVALWFRGWVLNAGTPTTEYIRYSFVYDGVQESLLSPPIYSLINDTVQKGLFRIGLGGEDELDRRVTAINIYSVTGSGSKATADLITSVSLTGNVADRVNYGTLGKGGARTTAGDGVRRYVWLTDILEADKPEAEEYFGQSDLASSYVKIMTVTDLGTDGVLLTVNDTTKSGVNSGFTDMWDSGCFISPDGNPSGVGLVNGVYGGPKIIIDTSVDFNLLNPLGENAVTASSDGTQAHGATGATDYTMKILNVAKHAVQVDAAFNDIPDFTYNIDTHPYIFYTENNEFYLMVALDFASKEATEYPLEGEVSIKVNADHAIVIGNRLWQGRAILDPGGENEVAHSSALYSEVDQYDVNPVSNRINLHDREGGGITGIAELFERPVYAMKQNITLIDSTNTDDTLWRESESPHNIGNIAKHGMISVLGIVYVIYYDGIYGLRANNLAETDQTPTERLKITDAIQDTYDALTTTQKEDIKSEHDQGYNEILFRFNTEIWAVSTKNGAWREIASAATFDILTLDENASVMAWDDTDDTLKSFDIAEAVTCAMRTKFFFLSDDRKEAVRYVTVKYVSASNLTLNIYTDDDDTTPIATATLALSATPATVKVAVRKHGLNFAVEVLDSVAGTGSVEIHKIKPEVSI